MAEASFAGRLSDSGPLQTLPPIRGWEKAPSLSIRQAISVLGLDDTELFCRSALDFADDYFYKHRESKLTVDEAAAINLYTQEDFLYGKFNGVLRDRDRTKVKPWFPYVKLFMCGLDKLRTAAKNFLSPGSRTRVTWRGVNKPLASSYRKGKEFTEWSVLSTTSDDEVVEKFLGKRKSTVFCVEGFSGVDIRDLSAYKREDEVVYAPGTRFVVETAIKGATNVIRIREAETGPQSAEEQFAIGEELEKKKKDFVEAVKYYRLAADQGLAKAQSALGFCYKKGIGVTKDVKEAVRLYQLAADQGDPSAQSKLGYCYSTGIGVEKDVKEAVRLYRLSADQGHPSGQCNLGFCYESGTGVEKDVKEAVRLYQLSADQGHPGGQCNLGFCYKSGTGVEKDVKEGVRLYRLSADQGDPSGQCTLGFCYESGTGVEKDIKEAVRLYRLSAGQGHPGGQCTLGFCYKSGTGVEKDVKEAVRLYRMSADQGHPDGQCNLGTCYENGTGIEKDVNEAVRLYRLAADQGHAFATRKLCSGLSG